LPARVLLLEGNYQTFNAPNSYTTSAARYNTGNVPNTSYPNDPRFVERVAMSQYDGYGNLTRLSVTNGPATTFAYTTIVPSAGRTFSYPISQTLNAGQSSSQVSGYSYSVPLLDLSQTTAPNGVQTSFIYDSFGRLKAGYDHYGQLLAQYSYNYPATSAASLPATPTTPTSTQAYVLTQLPRDGSSVLPSATSSFLSLQATIAYFDGLGRPAQTVQWRGAGDATADLASQTLSYDAYGRAVSSLLPSPTTASTGAYVPSLTATAQSFYSDSYPYGETTYEDSPLNRTLRQYGPGQGWRSPTVPVSKAAVIAYGTASANSVIRFTFNNFCNCLYGHIENQTGANYYGPTDIATQTATDEQGNIVTIYTDLQGRVVRRDVRVAVGQTLTTAYVYDSYERLAAVLPPMAYGWFTADISRNLFVYSNSNDDATFSELAYGYLYDNRSRLIRKNVPGAGWTDLVYDSQDRLVMSQDAQDRNEAGGAKWRFRQYDGLGRVLQTGRLTLSATASSLQQSFSALSGETYPASVNPSAGDYLTQDQYDTYTGAAFSFNTTGNFATPFPSAASPNARGLLTRSRTRNLETGTWYESVVWYDDKGRVIQQQSQNHLGGNDRMDTQYRFNGEVLQRVLRHQPASGASLTTVASSYSYDHLSRPAQTTHALNGATPTVLATYRYDGIGRMVSKSLGGGFGIASQQSGSWNFGSTWQGGGVPGPTERVVVSAGHSVTIPANTSVGASQLVINPGGRVLYGNAASRLRFLGRGTLQVLGYQYHIRGGLRGINLDAGGNVPGSALFAMKLGYEDAGRYDGNIGSQTWLSPATSLTTTPSTRSYSYSYDGASRLTGASYGGNTYTVSGMSYDGNGNLQSLNRQGVDALTYRYQTNSNKLLAVTDGNASNEGFADGNKSGDDYDYWPDGSLKKDLNRGMSLIEYNLLKLPSRVTYSNGTIVTYQYDTAGNKLKMSVSGGEVRDYVGPFQYLTPAGGSRALFNLLTDEGRYTPASGYEYFNRDHLGNVRVVIGNGGVTQYTDYDPWGLPLWGGASGGSSTNRMKFNGQESVSELGSGQYDLGARGYDSPIGRMKGIDPLAERHLPESPHSFGGNNPIGNLDPSGMDWYKHEETGAIFWSNSQEASLTVGEQTFTNVGTRYAYTQQIGTGDDATTVLQIGNDDGTTTTYFPNEYGVVKFPEEGNGFSRYTNNNSDDAVYMGFGRTPQGDNWINPTTGAAFYNLIQKFNRLQNVQVHYGDISASDPAGINLGHATHTQGRAIDIHYMGVNGEELTGEKAYSIADTCIMNCFMREAENQGFTRNYTYGNRFNHVGNRNHSVHKNHLHIGQPNQTRR
jgi:RHS repeat-associated protein